LSGLGLLVAHQLVGRIDRYEAMSNGMGEHEPQRRPPCVDRVAHVPSSELVTVPRDEIIGRDRCDAALSEGRHAVQS
jgi:hypothetical protein